MMKYNYIIFLFKSIKICDNKNPNYIKIAPIQESSKKRDSSNSSSSDDEDLSDKRQ